ncbi:hypothetical protein EVAR_72618_1 [Eumeta japonica]|uniref:Uncharacterized protein n=1 Tax=Eumeta variegata TaxID=151549 RepID=A0A4C2AF69_EUMVA|nr:hypothetical protein EVAR_72618_1 [Eumeta japonica]
MIGLKAAVITARPLIGVSGASGANAYEIKCMATPPQLKCMQLTCATDAPPIKCSGSGASDTVASQPSPCKLGLIKSLKENAVHHLIAATPRKSADHIERSVRIVKRGNPGAGLRGDS